MKKRCDIALLFVLLSLLGNAQVITKVDTLKCSIIGFNAGVMGASGLLSAAVGPDGTSSKLGTMHDLYKSPYLQFGGSYMYKTLSNWMFSFDANMFFGTNNLNDREQRMGIWTNEDPSIIIGTNGTDANVICYNRGLSFQAGVGRIFAPSTKNPNSGLFVRLSGGLMTNQTIFFNYDVHAPQVEGTYAHLYDHQRIGGMLTESVGYLFMSNHKAMVNFYVAFELSQCWNQSTRPYVIDNVMNLSGPDNNSYFDFMYGLKLCWMIPLTGKPNYDYYFY